RRRAAVGPAALPTARSRAPARVPRPPTARRPRDDATEPETGSASGLARADRRQRSRTDLVEQPRLEIGDAHDLLLLAGAAHADGHLPGFRLALAAHRHIRNLHQLAVPDPIVERVAAGVTDSTDA